MSASRRRGIFYDEIRGRFYRADHDDLASWERVCQKLLSGFASRDKIFVIKCAYAATSAANSKYSKQSSDELRRDERFVEFEITWRRLAEQMRNLDATTFLNPRSASVPAIPPDVDCRRALIQRTVKRGFERWLGRPLPSLRLDVGETRPGPYIWTHEARLFVEEGWVAVAFKYGLYAPPPESSIYPVAVNDVSSIVESVCVAEAKWITRRGQDTISGWIVWSYAAGQPHRASFATIEILAQGKTLAQADQRYREAWVARYGPDTDAAARQRLWRPSNGTFAHGGGGPG